MEKHLNVLSQALNKANQSGAFNLQESAVVAQALGAVIQALTTSQPNPIEVARAEAKVQHSGDGNMEKQLVAEVTKKDSPQDDPKDTKDPVVEEKK